MLRTLHLYGILEKLIEHPTPVRLERPSDLLSIVKSWRGVEALQLLKDQQVAVVVSGDNRSNARPVLPEYLSTPLTDDVTEVHVLPATQGAGIEAALIAWGASAATAAAVSSAIVSIAISVALGAVSRALAPKPQSTGSARPEERPSYIYNGPENVTEQGYMVPIVYGRHMTGSVVVSAGITVEQLGVPTARTPPPEDDPVVTNPPAVDDQWPTGGA